MALTSSVPLPKRAAAVASVINDYIGAKSLVPLGVFLSIAERESQFREDAGPRPTKSNPSPTARGPWQLLKPIAAYLKIQPVSHRALLEVSTPIIVRELMRAARMVKKARPNIDKDNLAGLVYFAHSEGPGALKRGLKLVLANHLPVTLENVSNAVGRINVGPGLQQVMERWKFWEGQKSKLLSMGDAARTLAAGPHEAEMLVASAGTPMAGLDGLDEVSNRYEAALTRRWALDGLESSWYRRWGTSVDSGGIAPFGAGARMRLVRGRGSCHPVPTTLDISGYPGVAVRNDVLGLGDMTTYPNAYGHPVVARPYAYERWRGSPAFLRGGAFGTCYKGQGCAPSRNDLDRYGLRGGGGGFLDRHPSRPFGTTMKPWGGGSEAIVERQLSGYFGIIEPKMDHRDDENAAAMLYWKSTDDWTTGKPAIPHEGGNTVVATSDGKMLPIILDGHGNAWVRDFLRKVYLPVRPDLLDREKLTKSKI